MNKAITMRLDPGLIAEAKELATIGNRTLTNFIETLLKRRFVEPNLLDPRMDEGHIPLKRG